MIRRGLTRKNLVAMTGLNPGTITNIMSGYAGRFSITAIEKALGVRIFTEGQDADTIINLQKILGVDVRTAKYWDLRKIAALHNLPGRAALRKAELIQLLKSHLLPATAKRRSTSPATNKKRQR